MTNNVNNVTGILSDFLNGVARLTRGVASLGEEVVDFAYVRVLGLPFVVLGYRQTGKTTLLENLRRDLNLDQIEGFEPDPTAAGGDAVPAFTTKLERQGFRLRPKRDVGGEYAMWETDWVDLLNQTRPRGIIFMMDHTRPYQHKDAFNFVMNMIDDEPAARRHLQAVMVLVNKQDLWDEGQAVDDILLDFRNETRRLKSQSERVGYETFIMPTSLVTGEGVEEAMLRFFNAIRPKAR